MRSTSRWIIRTNRGDEMRAKFVSMANGYQAKPKLPGYPRNQRFRGQTFHTSRWDYGYTGEKLENLAGKRVGIIGTGATAVQCVPHLGAAARATLRLPAHSVIGRRACQRADGSAVGQRISSRDGNASACRTFRSSPPVGRPQEDLVADAGRASPASSR